jgi:hypothetical protein
MKIITELLMALLAGVLWPFLRPVVQRVRAPCTVHGGY